MEYDRARESMAFAAQFGNFEENLNLKNMVETQMANIDFEENEASGVAQKSNDDDN